MEQNTHTYALV